VQLTCKRFLGVPGFWLGTLFVLASPALGQADLAADLFEEGNWAACRRECRRTLDGNPADERAELLGAVCDLRLGRPAPASLGRLAVSGTTTETRAMAAYELGRAEWAAGRPGSAYPLLRQAFLEAPSQDLFARAGCSLDLLQEEVPTLGKNDPAVFQSLETSRALWTREVRQECALPRERGTSLTAMPAQWIVAFYRGLIRPAIGTRCSLHPSCSHYFEEAAREHGLLAFPIAGDRLVREPDVVAAAEDPVQVGGQTRYADPLRDHTGWMRKK
jgi:putative component of membrane protein insertase Oxa1/YidC/SpoIIIJ protein YidD